MNWDMEEKSYFTMDPLSKYLAKRIIIELSPLQFTFSIREKNICISFAPFMYLQRDENMWIPIAIGEEIPVEYSNNPDVFRIAINDFRENLSSNSIISNESFLQLLFEYGIGRCFESFWIPQLKSVVYILGASRFNEHFKNPREMLELVAKRGGAKHVVFDKIEP